MEVQKDPLDAGLSYADMRDERLGDIGLRVGLTEAGQALGISMAGQVGHCCVWLIRRRGPKDKGRLRRKVQDTPAVKSDDVASPC